MINRFVLYALCSCFIGVVALPARAGFISIQVGCEVQAGQLVVTVQNVGDEPGQNIFATVNFLDQTYEAEIARSLPPNKPVSRSFPLEISGLQGVYSVITIVDFEDLNSYSFSAVSVQRVRVGEISRTKLAAILDPVEMRKKAKTRLTMRSDDETEITARLRIVTPREMIAQPSETTVTIPPMGTTEMKVVIDNLSGTPTSSYPIHAVLEYEEGGIHFCEIAMIMVPVLAANPVAVGRFWIVIAVVIAVVAILFAPKLKKMLRK